VWKIEKIVSKGDYNYAVVPDHPLATKNGYVLEHRIVMENHIGRLLSSEEIVHHKNDCKKDNRIENLQLMSAFDHQVLHACQNRVKKMVQLKCPSCHTLFVKDFRMTFLVPGRSEYTCCSNSCRGKFSRFVQLNGRTPEVELAISENLVREFFIPRQPRANRETAGCVETIRQPPEIGEDIVQPTTTSRRP
jgi:hypothetical protein